MLGTNGAGKSTLLRAISGLTPPKGGKVLLDGRDVTGTPPWKMAGLGVAHMPGGRGIFPDLTVGENLRMATWSHRRNKKRSKEALERALELFPGLSDPPRDPGRAALRRPAADAGPGPGVHARTPAAAGRRTVARPRPRRRDGTARGRAPPATTKASPSCSSSSRPNSPSRWPTGPCSWRRARPASPARPGRSSNAATSCGRCSCPAPATTCRPAATERRPSDKTFRTFDIATLVHAGKTPGHAHRPGAAQDLRRCHRGRRRRPRHRAGRDRRPHGAQRRRQDHRARPAVGLRRPQRRHRASRRSRT